MSFAQFRSASLREFLATARDTDALWFFVHVPKTAGSSLSTEMIGMRPPYLNVEIDYARRARDYDNALNETVTRFFSLHRQISFRSASGHVPVSLLERLAPAGSKIRLFTLLRDPVQRVISDYVYQTTPDHPPYMDFRRQFPTIEQYVLNRSEQNKMFLFLSGETNPDCDFEAAYAAIVERFSFIGLMELYPMSFNIISRMIGSSAMPKEHQRKTDEGYRRQVPVGSTTIDMIRSVNRLDQMLFERVSGLLLPKLKEWTALQGETASA